MKKAKNIALKRTLNLAAREKDRANDPKVILPLALITAVAIAVFCKFAVIDRIGAASNVYSEINYINQRTDNLREENEKYDDVKKEYEHYTYSAYSDDELAIENVENVFSLIDSKLILSSQITSLVFNSNVLNVVINNVTLQDVSLIVSDLYESPMVKSVDVSTAFTNGNGSLSHGQNVTANIAVTLKPADNVSSNSGSGGDQK